MKSKFVLNPPSIFHNETEENLSKSGIYCIYFNNNKNIIKYYVGSANIAGCLSKASKGFWARWRLHLNSLEKKIHHSIALQRAYNKYGKENIQFKILEFCNSEKIVEREQYWIDFLQGYKKGYNCLPFARSSKGAKIILNRSGKKVYQFDIFGNLIAEYVTAREADRQTGFKYKLIHKCCVGKCIFYKNYTWRFSKDDFFKFKVVSKIDVSKKQVAQYDLQGNLINKYPTITEASKKTNITLSNISMCLRNQRNSAGGFKWIELK